MFLNKTSWKHLKAKTSDRKINIYEQDDHTEANSWCLLLRNIHFLVKITLLLTVQLQSTYLWNLFTVSICTSDNYVFHRNKQDEDCDLFVLYGNITRSTLWFVHVIYIFFLSVSSKQEKNRFYKSIIDQQNIFYYMHIRNHVHRVHPQVIFIYFLTGYDKHSNKTCRLYISKVS